MSVQDINRVTITGRVVADGLLKTTRNGKNVLLFTIASTEKIATASGGFTEHVNFIPCVLFGQYAESAAMYVRKGVPMTLEGHLRQSSWDKDGQHHEKMEVYVDHLIAHDKLCLRGQVGA